MCNSHKWYYLCKIQGNYAVNIPFNTLVLWTPRLQHNLFHHSPFMDEWTHSVKWISIVMWFDYTGGYNTRYREEIIRYRTETREYSGITRNCISKGMLCFVIWHYYSYEISNKETHLDGELSQQHCLNLFLLLLVFVIVTHFNLSLGKVVFHGCKL